LIQTAGRAARNLAGKVIFYADGLTNSMKKAMRETERRRQIQLQYNQEHGIVPQTIKKTEEEIRRSTLFADSRAAQQKTEIFRPPGFEQMTTRDKIAFLKQTMEQAADSLEFEVAATIRDEIDHLRKKARYRKKKPRR
jgi:excinuclease ABC subunit B